MDIEGTIIMDLPLQEGIGKASGKAWKKKEWVLETPGPYPRKVKFHVFGETRVNELKFEIGKAYRISFDLESREFNERWYTDVSAYAATPIEIGMMSAAPMGQPMGQPMGAQAPGFAPAPGYAASQQPQAPMYGQPAAPASADPFAGESNETDDLPF